MNSVLQNDILSLMRLKRVAVTQIAFVAIMALVVLVAWPQGGAGTSGEGLTLSLLIGQLALLALLVPGIAAVIITGERRAGTLDALYASHVPPRQIITGKVGLAIAYSLLLLISGLPFVALLAWRGELGSGQLPLAYGVLAISAISLAIFSLGVSAICHKSATALIVVYVTILIAGGGVLAPAAFMLDGATGDVAMWLHYVRGTSPVGAVLSILKPRLNDLGGMDHAMTPVWMVFLPVAGVVSAVSLMLVAMRLRKAPPPIPGLDAAKSGVQQRPRRWMAGWAIRVLYASLVLSLVSAGAAFYGEPRTELRRCAVQSLLVLIALVSLLAPSLTVGAISGDIEDGTFEGLRSTPRAAGRVFWRKLLLSIVLAVLPMLALLPAYVAICLIDVQYKVHLMRIGPVVILGMFAMSFLGLACSAWAGSTVRAMVAAYVIAPVLVIGPMAVWLASESHLLSTQSARWIAFLSPMVMSLNLLPVPRAEIADLRVYHLAAVASLCVVMLLLTRVRLASLLRHG